MSPAVRPAPPGSSPTRSPQDESAPDRLLALADRCVQCGLCLPACPTYLLDRTEAESPRGRIALARAWESGLVEPTAVADRHLDHCLGCRSCEAVCPADVAYGELLVAARTRQRERRGHGWRQRTAEWLTARPGLLSLLLSVYRRLFDRLPAKLRPLPRPPGAVLQGQPPRATPEATVALFMGCVARPYETALREALARLCAAAGFAIHTPESQTCCGALHAHGGASGAAARLAATNRAALSSHQIVLTLASGCHEAVHDALSGTTTVSDAIAFLHRHVDRLAFNPRNERIALHLPCTQRNVVGSAAALRALLARVPGLQLLELPHGYGCCGAAGTQMLLEPDRAAAYRQPLIEAFENSGATRLLSANIGCRLHFANATAKPVQHPLEFLAECLTDPPHAPPKAQQ
ncbi:(Fe-S)-binding protein [Lysobacter terrae]